MVHRESTSSLRLPPIFFVLGLAFATGQRSVTCSSPLKVGHDALRPSRNQLPALEPMSVSRKKASIPLLIGGDFSIFARESVGNHTPFPLARTLCASHRVV